MTSDERMNQEIGHPPFPKQFWLTVAMFLLLLVSFGIAFDAEKKFDMATNQRYRSFVLADQLRQSSDDLTRMARTYVVTGNPRYKTYYQDILDIRDGKKPRPEKYLMQPYWDMVLGGALAPPDASGTAISLMTLMRREGFTNAEFDKLAEAKSNSDALVGVELTAMKMAESTGSDALALRSKAIQMLHDDRYHQAKADIMRPISDFFNLMDRRTATAISAATRGAELFRLVFLAFVAISIAMLLRAYLGLRKALGGTVEEVQFHLLRIGRGDLSAPIRSAPDNPDSVLTGLSQMQTQLRRSEIERNQADSQLRIAAVAFESQESMMVTDARGVILRINRAFTESTGYRAEEIVGKTPKILQSGRHDADFYNTMWGSIRRTGGWQGEIWDRRKNGEIYPKWLTISAVRDAAGDVTHYVGTHNDITERKKAEDKIRELAFFDQLTGLPNRTLLQDRLRQSMTVGARNACYGALLFIDLDNFKRLNDTLGHDMGDELLRQVAQRLISCVRAEDTVARLGGDEFVVILSSLSEHEAAAASQTEVVGNKILSCLNQIYLLNDVEHHSTPSIGATLFFGHLASIDDLMKQADLAMYKAKAHGRNALRFFDPEMEKTVLQNADL